MTVESTPALPIDAPVDPVSAPLDANPALAAATTPTSETMSSISPGDNLLAENLALSTRLREVLLATDAAIAPELVTGETVAEIEASYAAAKALADRVRESVRRESLAAGASAVPVGAPGRSQTRPLNALEKIRAGLSRPAGSAGSIP